MMPGQDNGVVKVIDAGTFLEGPLELLKLFYFKTGTTLLEICVCGLLDNGTPPRK